MSSRITCNVPGATCDVLLVTCDVLRATSDVLLITCDVLRASLSRRRQAVSLLIPVTPSSS
jgi:hypothetical protein